MKHLIIFLSFALISLTGLSQNVKVDSTGNYVAAQHQDSAKATGKTYTDSKGNVYPVFVSKSGKPFVKRKSNNTGKEYRQYLKID